MSDTADTTPQTLLKEQIYNTVAYFDLFDFAPTLMEIERWLLRPQSKANQTTTAPSLSQIQSTLEKDNRIQQHEAYYFIKASAGDHDRSHLPTLRKQKYIHSTEKWKYSRRFLKLLATMPSVQGIWLANSAAWGNARQGSDIDLVIIAAPNRIWTARFFTTFWMKLFRQRPHETDHSKALCLSFYLSEDNLNLEQYKIDNKDIHFSFWATQFYPLYDTGLYTEFSKQNPWLSETFTNTYTVKTIGKRTVTLGKTTTKIKQLLEKLPLENVLKRFQLRILPEPLAQPKPNSGVVINDRILKLHTNDNREDIQKRWTGQVERVS